MAKPNILTIDPLQEGVSARVPRLGDKDHYKRPEYEVGEKLAVKNLHATRIELVQALRKGFKKRDLMVIVGPEKMARIFLVAGFVAKYMVGNEDLCGEILDRKKYLDDHKLDRDMIYVRIDSRETRKCEVGFLDQPTRRTYSTADTAKIRKAIIQAGSIAHPSGFNRHTRRANGIN